MLSTLNYLFKILLDRAPCTECTKIHDLRVYQIGWKYMVHTNYIFNSFLDRAHVLGTHKKIPTVLQAPCPDVAHIQRADKMPQTPQDPCPKCHPQTLCKHKETNNPSDPSSNAANLQHTQCTQEDDSNNLSSCFSSFYFMLSHLSAFTHRMSWRLHNLKLLIATHFMSTEILYSISHSWIENPC
jgi:hypothetical protein